MATLNFGVAVRAQENALPSLLEQRLERTGGAPPADLELLRRSILVVKAQGARVPVIAAKGTPTPGPVEEAQLCSPARVDHVLRPASQTAPAAVGPPDEGGHSVNSTGAHHAGEALRLCLTKHLRVSPSPPQLHSVSLHPVPDRGLTPVESFSQLTERRAIVNQRFQLLTGQSPSWRVRGLPIAAGHKWNCPVAAGQTHANTCSPELLAPSAPGRSWRSARTARRGASEARRAGLPRSPWPPPVRPPPSPARATAGSAPSRPCSRAHARSP